MRNSQLVIQSEEFSVIIVLLSDKLNAQRNYDISSQILKSGTSIGANIAEAVYAESTAD
ncbi:MAG: four helix bundle protein, partial [Clostridia bacterium]|nr:four helix bundle protein [Clostridia bacterium]